MITWKASITVEVKNINDAMKQAVSIVEKSGGYIENKSISGEKSAYLTLRVPAIQMTSILDELAASGKEKHCTTSSEDVTEQYIDTEARLKNTLALRDRLKELLKQATAVQDILEIEKELTRVQSDIDAMEGKIKSLKGRVDFAQIYLYLEREKILGPLGYVSYGIYWFFKKLFIIR